MTTLPLRRPIPPAALPVALVVAPAVTALLAAALVGPAGLVLGPLAVAALVSLRHPKFLLAVFVTVVIVFEDDEEGALPWQTEVFSPLPGTITPAEALFGLVLVATILHSAARREPPRLPRELLPFGVLLIGAVATGVVMGLSAGAPSFELQGGGRTFLLLLALPLVVATLVRTERDVRIALTLLVVLVLFKAVSGLVLVAAGQGREIEDSRLTFYEPGPNWLLLVCLLTLLGASLRTRPSPWTVGLFLLSTAALLLSYRRSFWIAGVLGIALVLLFGLRPSGWGLSVPVVALVLAAGWAVTQFGALEGLSGPVITRAESLRPSQVQAKPEDRYRIDERRNVVLELRRAPITGLGLGVPWKAREPLSIEAEGRRNYVHTAVLFWWLKLGLLGALAYVALLAAVLVAGLRLARTPGALPWWRAVGLASVAAILGLAVIETTTTFSGVDLRFTVLLGAQLGLLCVLRRLAAERR